jgi:hypothetical protein
VTAAYPQRPPYFACKFVRLLTKKVVANELGPQVFTLLAVVAMQEDAGDYSGAVNWYNHQLMPLIGAASEDTLDRVRRKAIAAGWLNYTPGGKGRPGHYYVVVPEQYRGTDDAPTDEGERSSLLRTGAEQSAEVTSGPSAGVITWPRTDAEATAEQCAEITPLLRTGAEESAEVNASSADNSAPVRREAEGMCGTPIPKKKKEEKTEDPPNPPQAGGSTSKAKKSKTRSSGPPASAPLVFPQALDCAEFRTAWSAWEQHRCEVKKRLTPTTIAKQLKMLEALGAQRAVRCIDHTIERGWIGLREPDGASSSAPKSPTEPVAPQCRPLTPFESQHMRFNPATGAERDANGSLILDQLCRDPACTHCQPRRKEIA